MPEDMVRADNNEPYWLAKQRTFGDNIIACYASNNVDVTTAALDRVERGAMLKASANLYSDSTGNTLQAAWKN
jgi:hypothetical protein